MIRILSISIFLQIPVLGMAQEDSIKEGLDTQVFTIVEEMPVYPGGDEALFGHLMKNTQYPPEAKEKGEEGTTYIGFIIEKDGHMDDFKILRGSHPALDAEAMRVIRTLESFKPGYQRGKPVRVSMIIPVRFILNNSANSPKEKNDRKKPK